MEKKDPIQQFYEAMQDRLMSSYRSDMLSPVPIKGANREVFVTKFLERLFPRHIRFGSGIIVDQKGCMSGQCDIVAEWPWGPSLQIEDNTTRYYFADLVAAVVSIKSNLKDQWSQVNNEAEKLKNVDFTVNPQQVRFESWKRSVPLFCVGYVGFSTIEEAKDKFDATTYDRSQLALLSVETGVYISGFGDKVSAYSGWSGLHCFVADLVDKSVSVMMEPSLRGYLKNAEMELK